MSEDGDFRGAKADGKQLNAPVLYCCAIRNILIVTHKESWDFLYA
jgi:hypothetical protein